MKIIERQDYLNWLLKYKDTQIIKVISGVRRCGKSTLFEIYQNHLINNTNLKVNIISVNFEDLEFEDLLDYRRLYQYIKENLVEDTMNYIFLDEIQHVNQYQKVVDSLLLKTNCDIYITGSNAYFMSSELATLLTGRYIELSMMPLSFKEFANTNGNTSVANKSLSELFNKYIEIGSFPFVSKYGYDQKEAREYMSGIYNTILLNDIAKRLKINDLNMLEDVTRFMLFNIGNRTSASNIANTMTSNHKKIDPKTVDRYIRGITDSLLMYEAKRYDIRGKEFLRTKNKYYAADVAMRNMLVKGSSSDIGHILENIVYLELKRRGYDVYVGKIGSDGEVDFVAMKDGEIEYYQVSETALSENVLNCELKPLMEIKDNYKKVLLTMDEVFSEKNYEGIEKKNILEWLIEY